MKIAVLVMGMPRCLHEGAWWFHNKCTPVGDHYEMDFYVHTWDDNSLNLRGRIQQEWKTDKIQIDNFNDVFKDWYEPIERYNSIDGKGKYLEEGNKSFPWEQLAYKAGTKAKKQFKNKKDA